MRLFSLLPRARRISRDELELQEVNDHVFSIKPPDGLLFTMFLVMIAIALCGGFFDEYIEAHPSIHSALFFSVFTLLGSLFLMIFMANLNFVFASGRLVEIRAKGSEKIPMWLFFTGTGVILLGLAVATSSKGNKTFSTILWLFLAYLLLRQVINRLILPLARHIALKSRKKHCTAEVMANLIRIIPRWDAKEISPEDQYGGLPLYYYCYDGQYYSMTVKDDSNISPEEYNSFAICIDPKKPDKYYSDKLFVTDFQPVERFLSIFFKIAFETLPFWLFLLYRFFIAKK